MGILDSLLAGAKAFVRDVFTTAAHAVRSVLVEFDRSAVGQATAQLIRGVATRYFRTAADLAAEERELAEKFIRDKRRSSADIDRIQEIAAERRKLRVELEAAQSRDAVLDLAERTETTVAAPVTDDEASAVVGTFASRPCSCGASMRLNHKGYNVGSGRRYFFWRCTAPNTRCLDVAFDPRADHAKVLRQPDANFDLSLKERRAIWTRSDVLLESASRMRQGLGDADANVVCPTHLLPMKLVEKPRATGTLLDTYEYACLAVNPDGRSCTHRVSVETFPQVSEALRRREGRGIIR